MSVVVAIDAGQTHTECVVVDRDGQVVGTGEGGPSYVQDGSMVVATAFDAACDAANVAAADVRAVLVGATGGQIPGRLDAVRGAMQRRFPAAHIEVVPDGEFVLRGCVGTGIGGVLIAGTGSVAIGNAGRGCVTVGGYGYLFGDEGAGSWLVLEWVRRSLREADRRTPPTALAHRMCQHFAVEDVREIPGVVYARGTIDVHAIASAAILIVHAAPDDPQARRLVEEAGGELAGLAERLAVALDLDHSSAFPLYLVGGIWQAHTLLLPAFRAALPTSIQWTLEQVEGSPTAAAARSLLATIQVYDGPQLAPTPLPRV
jgi:N-acetylglucosamine kinase-like BadF-type ATPase